MPKIITKKKAPAKVTKPLKTVKEIMPREKVANVFIAEDRNNYQFSLGTLIASGFSGFIAGMVVSTLVWLVIIQSFFVN